MAVAAIMFVIGPLVIIAGVIALIVQLVRRQSKKIPVILMLGGLGLFILSLIITACISVSSKDSETTASQTPAIVSEEVSSAPEATDQTEQEESAVVEFDTTGYTMMDAEILYEYGSYIGGENVVTVIEVSNKYNSELKANTNNNGSFFYSIVCNFSSSSKLKNVDEGDIVTIAGTVKEESSKAWDTVNLEDCEVIGTGEIADELKSNTDAQIEFCQQKQAEQDAVEAEAASAEKSAYISQCESVSYDDVARNPDKYEGKLIVVSGTVDQVSEGWFDSVTLRVKSNGNYWYVTHTREDGESRVLEGDYVTIYGECQGVKTYTTVLGSSKTIPAMRAEYID